MCVGISTLMRLLSDFYLSTIVFVVCRALLIAILSVSLLKPNHSSFSRSKYIGEIPTGTPTEALDTGGIYRFRDFLS